MLPSPFDELRKLDDRILGWFRPLALSDPMNPTYFLESAAARAVAAAGEAAAQRIGWAVSMALVDHGGRLLWRSWACFSGPAAR